MAEEVSMSKKGAIGSIRIADEVVGIIAGLAATEIDGVAGMSGGIAGGIVSGIVGIIRLEIVLHGQANHTGTTPMPLRHDALTAAA